MRWAKEEAMEYILRTSMSQERTPRHDANMAGALNAQVHERKHVMEETSRNPVRHILFREGGGRGQCFRGIHNRTSVYNDQHDLL